MHPSSLAYLVEISSMSVLVTRVFALRKMPYSIGLANPLCPCCCV